MKCINKFKIFVVDDAFTVQGNLMTKPENIVNQEYGFKSLVGDI